MNIGISTSSFFTKAPTETTFEIIKNFGCDICEVFLSSFSEYSGEIRDRIVKNRCIKVHSIHALTNQYEPELFSKNQRAADDSERILRKVLETGKLLNASNYTFHGATRLKKIDYKFDYDRLGLIINHIVDICAEYGIDLCYETVHWAYFNAPDYFIEIKKRCPNIKATLDIKQIMQADNDYRDYIKVIGERLKTVHVCDYDGDRNLFLPGRGTFDFTELFLRLNDNGFNGALIMEVYPQSYNSYEELKNAYEYLLECYDKANI